MAEALLGSSILEAAKFVVENNPQISKIYYRKYIYVPQTPTGIEGSYPVQRDDFLKGLDPNFLIDPHDSNSNVALDSSIETTNGNKAYFLMMDLNAKKSPQMLEFLTQRFREIITPYLGGGILLETNRSYHYLGKEITDWEGWNEFIARCLLTSTVIEIEGKKTFVEVPDTRYIGYSMLRGSTGLRVTTRGTKTFDPKIVSILD